MVLSLSLIVLLHSASAQSPSMQPATETSLPSEPAQTTSGSISGTIVDSDGDVIPDAHITLARVAQISPDVPSAEQPVDQVTIAARDGSFSFSHLPPGPFKLTVTAARFTTRQISGALESGENYPALKIVLPSATSIEVQITASPQEVAEAQIQVEEKQRVFGVIPNFYVNYMPNPAPLSPRQKTDLAWKTLIDPVTFLTVGIIAGIQQADDSFDGYGQGALGYGKRYAATYGNTLTGTLIGGAILPVIFKQDPRFFFKKDGSVWSRIEYSMATAVICKGDNGHWQVNYSGILGSAASGVISNYYYPSGNRDGVALSVENGAFGILSSAISNMFQEFLIPRFTPHKYGLIAPKS